MFAIWMPMLAGDARDAWDGNVLDDPRVVSLWDGNRLAGTWFGDRTVGGIGGPGYPVWDAYFAFAKSEHSLQKPLVAGSDIIDNTRALEQRFVPLLER